MIVINHAQLATLAKLDEGHGVRVDLYESDEGGEIVVHVLGALGYSVEFLRLDGTLAHGRRA